MASDPHRGAKHADVTNDLTARLAAWEKRAQRELAGAPLDSLRTKLPEGLVLEPLYLSGAGAHVAAGSCALGEREAPLSGGAAPAVEVKRLNLEPWDGAHAVDQLGIALAMVVDALRAGTTAVVLDVPIGPDILSEIAKLRALRRLCARAVELTEGALELRIHAATRYREAAADLATNLIRNTAAVFAAITGGADTVAPLAHSADPDDQRLADNVARLAIHEAHLARVRDPAAGSYALETLTEAFCQGGWGFFQELEKHGGYADPRARVIAESRFTSGGER